jgi:uncharacterized protein YfdQ (DUF2303 family)
MAREKGYKTNDKYNKKIQAEVHEYIIANFRIECKPYKGRKTDYQKEIKPVLLKEETRQIEMFSPKYNTKKNS